jgi:transposase
MKNKMIKRSHLSEKKCREIIQLFSEDLTATQIANITGVSRVTINNYLKLIRTQIAKHCEEQNPRYYNTGVIPALNPRNGTPKNDEQFNAYYGFFRFNGNILVDWLHNVDKAGVQELQRSRLLNANDSAVPNELMKYNAIADFEGWRLYRIDTSNTVNGKSQVDDISVFWGNTKSRLLKFRGLNKNTMYLHVKECEFRFNYRNDDINTVLLNIMYKRPLHFSKS